MSTIDIIQPLDQTGKVITRAMGLPVVVRTVYLGSATEWAILYNLSANKYVRRAFTGMSARNPSGSSEIILASVNNLMDTPQEFLAVGVQQYWTLDNLMYGPGVIDDSEGTRTKYILAKLSTAQGVQATGTITYAGVNPPNNSTFSILSDVYEFSSDQSIAQTSTFKVDIGASADITYTNLVNMLNLTQRYAVATINTGTDVVTLTANRGGTSGNAVTIAQSGTGATLSGANLASGTGGVLATFHIW